jgi:outer membrane protein assembly factor BamB
VTLTMMSTPHSRLRRSLEIAVICCLLAACGGGGGTQTTPVGPGWPMYRGDLARDGHPYPVTLDSAGAARLAVSWRAHLDGAIDGTPAVAGSSVVAGSAGGALVAFDVLTGATRWARHGLGAISDSPLIAGTTVYVGTLTGQVLAADLLTGKTRWSWEAPSDAELWSSPVLYGGVVIAGVASPYGDNPLIPGRLFGLDAVTGTMRWSSCIEDGCAPGGGVWSTPAIDQSGVAFVGVGNPVDGVVAFDPLTGKRKWLAALYPDRNRDVDVGASPIVLTLQGREVIAQATVAGTFALLDAATGAVVWSRNLVAGSAVHGLIASPAYDGALLYAGSASPPIGMFALRPRDGSTAWMQSTTLPVYSAPAVGAGVVVFGIGNVFGDLTAGAMVALSTGDGRVVWTYDTHSAVRSGPALAGDLVVVGDNAGDVLAFRPMA